MGISVTRYRYLHTLAGGAFAGVGGACFSLALTPAVGRRAHGGRRLDRDRARHLRVLARRSLPRRRLLLRRVLGAAVHAAGARGHDHAAVLPGAALRDDDRRARDRLLGARPAPPRRAREPRRPVRARGALAVDVLTPRSLDEALRLKAELPDARFVAGRHRRAGRAQLRPLAAAGADQPERGRRAARVGAARTARSCSAPGSRTRRRCAASSRPTLPALAEASRTVGSPQIRNRGTIGGNLGTARRPATRCRRCSSRRRWSSVASVRGDAVAAAAPSSCVGVKRNALADDELVVACGSSRVRRAGRRS